MPIYVDESTGARYESEAELTVKELDELFDKGSKAQTSPPATPSAAPAKKEEKSIAGFLSNIASNAGEIGSGIANIAKDFNPIKPIMRLVQDDWARVPQNSTLEGLEALTKGAGKGLMGYYGGNGVNPNDPDVKAFMNLYAPVGESFLNPAGIPGRVADYAYEKPLSTMMNLSAGAGVLGKGMEMANLSRAAGLLGKVSEVTDPIQASARMLSRTVSPVARKMYESSLKPSTTLGAAEREQLIQMGLDKAYPVSKEGFRTATKDYGIIGGEIDDLIKQAAQRGSTVNAERVAARIDDAIDFYKDLPKAQDYIFDLTRIKNDFQTGIIDKYGSLEIPIADAQAMKQKIYQMHKKHYNEMKGVEIDAEKQLARGIKEEIETLYPDIKKLNANSAEMRQFLPVLEKAVARTRNWDVIKLKNAMAGGIGTAVGGPAMGAGATLAAIVLGMPQIKTRLAIMLNKARGLTGAKTGTLANIAYQGSKLQQRQQEE